MSTHTHTHTHAHANTHTHTHRFSPDGSLIAVGSNDACVDVYSSEGLARVGYCRGIPSFVTHIDWSCDNKYLQVMMSS